MPAGDDVRCAGEFGDRNSAVIGGQSARVQRIAGFNLKRRMLDAETPVELTRFYHATEGELNSARSQRGLELYLGRQVNHRGGGKYRGWA